MTALASAVDKIYDKVVPGVGDFGADVDLSAMQFIPWKGRFLVKRFDSDKVTKGGITIPDRAQRKKNWGKVVTLPVDSPPPGIQVGDLVAWLDGAGEDLSESLGDGHVLLDYRDDFQNDVLGVFREKADGPKLVVLRPVAVEPPKRKR